MKYHPRRLLVVSAATGALLLGAAGLGIDFFRMAVHLLGAAGSVEAIFSILAMRDGIAPPTLNLDNPSEGCDIDLVPRKAKERKIRREMERLKSMIEETEKK